LLAVQRQQAEQQKESLDCVYRQLRQLHRSYVPDRGSAGHWQSFS
jgi:hypothetical protein